jgi:hypothetical protein
MRNNIKFKKMKFTMRSSALFTLIWIAVFAFYACEKPQIERPVNPDKPKETNIPELIITKYDGGNVEWVSLQKGTSADDKVADAKQDRNDIVQSNDTLFIQLVNINDTLPFTASGNYTVVLKHDQKDKMYIKLGVKFTDGLADLKWGGWFGVR